MAELKRFHKNVCALKQKFANMISTVCKSGIRTLKSYLSGHLIEITPVLREYLRWMLFDTTSITEVLKHSTVARLKNVQRV